MLETCLVILFSLFLPVLSQLYGTLAVDRCCLVTLQVVSLLIFLVETASGSSDSQRSLQPLACELKLISQLSAESQLHLTAILREIPSCSLASILHTYLLRDANGRLSAFQRYAKIFADSCVCAAFDKCVKDNR
jgi:hypothetical protein